MSVRAHRLGVAIDRRRVLHDVSLDVRDGEVLGVIGPNGAGKSTLLRALAGLVAPDAGAVLANGAPLAALRPRERAARAAFVAQDTGVAADVSALDLVLLGRYARRRRLAPATGDDLAIARDALDRVGMRGRAHRAVPSLSGGERQLVQIARALAQDADALLLDEPTSALDVHHALRVFGILRRHADSGAAVALVLHDLDHAGRHCDRIAVIEGGRLHALGPPAEVLTPALLADVYRVDARVEVDAIGAPRVLPLACLDERRPSPAGATAPGERS